MAWPGFLEDLAHSLDAKGCIIFELEPIEGNKLNVPLFSEAFDGDILSIYMTHFEQFECAEQKRFNQLVSHADVIDVIQDQQLFADEDTRVKQANVQALGSFGIGHRAFAMLDKDNRSRHRFSVQHSKRHGVLTGPETDVLKQILPHMAKALQLGRPLLKRKATHDGLVSAMSQLNVGICILDKSGVQVIANDEHNRQCSLYGTFRTSPSGVLRLNANGDSARLNALLGDMLLHGQFGARPRREAIPLDASGKVGAICLEITPRPEGGAILFSFDTSRPIQFDSKLVSKVFSLTATEAEILDLVTKGWTNAQIAEQRSRSTETINVQLKSILSKTNCVNRTQLVRLLVNFGAEIMRAP